WGRRRQAGKQHGRIRIYVLRFLGGSHLGSVRLGQHELGHREPAQCYFAFHSPGTVTGSTQIQLQRQLARLECPVEGFEPQSTQNAVQVQITAANITQNNITVVLSGPSGVTGNLNVQVTGTNGQSPIDPIENATLGPGTYNYNFGLSNI